MSQVMLGMPFTIFGGASVALLGPMRVYEDIEKLFEGSSGGIRGPWGVLLGALGARGGPWEVRERSAGILGGPWWVQKP